MNSSNLHNSQTVLPRSTTHSLLHLQARKGSPGPVFQARKKTSVPEDSHQVQHTEGKASHQPSYLLGPNITTPEYCCEDRLWGLRPESRVPLPHSSTRNPKDSEDCKGNRDFNPLSQARFIKHTRPVSLWSKGFPVFSLGDEDGIARFQTML